MVFLSNHCYLRTLIVPMSDVQCIMLRLKVWTVL